jgi:immunoglobulin-binding protein 1
MCSNIRQGLGPAVTFRCLLCAVSQDDISTAYLKYLLVPFYMAELLSSSRDPDLTQHLSSVGRAATLYNAFLHRCSSYDLMGRIAKTIYDREEDGAPMDPAMLRMSKVERFKRDRAIAKELEQVEQVGAAAAAAERDAEESGVDEEVARQLWQLQIEGACLRALEQRGMLVQEMQLLRHALDQQSGSASAGGSQQRQQAAETRETKQRMVAKLQGIVGQLESSERERLRQQVFRPSHILPTLTVEQQGMIELREAQERQRRQDEAAATRQAAREQRGSDDDADDQEVARQRAWDDFKDDNPRGAGNSKLRPCA